MCIKTREILEKNIQKRNKSKENNLKFFCSSIKMIQSNQIEKFLPWPILLLHTLREIGGLF